MSVVSTVKKLKFFKNTNILAKKIFLGYLFLTNYNNKLEKKEKIKESPQLKGALFFNRSEFQSKYWNNFYNELI